MTAEQDPAGMTAALSETLRKLNGQLKILDKRSRWGRRVTMGLTAVLALVVALAPVLVFVAVHLNTVSHQIHAQEVAICVSQNAFKAHAVQVWTFNVDTFHDNAQGAAELKLVRSLYKPVTCPR
jgi:hypothetical protein